MWIDFKRGFSIVMTFVTVSLTGDASSKIPRVSGGAELIAYDLYVNKN